MASDDAGNLDQPVTVRQSAQIEFEDRRDERRRNGMLKFRIEQGVPDVGGLGWRTRQGHLLKNQTFYASRPNENLWDNPSHAGAKTWKGYHGPKLRADAPLMERLDRIDAEQADWESRKVYMNTVRVQQLDRFYRQKVENDQKEMASQWAPHRRAKKEVHNNFNTFTAELDSMPMKELKKVLTHQVLKGDKEAIENITKRVQMEESWKLAWKNMEQERYKDIRTSLEQRMAYNDMLQELSGQPPRSRERDERPIRSDCSARIEELASPKSTRMAATHTGVTRHSDFKGLVHVDHQHALEARFPGQGHELSQEVVQKANESSQPPGSGNQMPRMTSEEPQISARDSASQGVNPSLSQSGTLSSGVNAGVRGLLRRRSSVTGGTDVVTGTNLSVTTASAPVSAQRLGQVVNRESVDVLTQHSSLQHQPAEAPPPPDQQKLLLNEPVINDQIHMSMPFYPRTDHTEERRSSVAGNIGSLGGRRMSKMDEAPPRRPVTYPVLVPNVENEMERPGWRPRHIASADPRRRSAPASRGGKKQPLSARATLGSRNPVAERWPPPNSKAVRVTIIGARDLPRSDRAGHSDPYATCFISGKPQSKVRTSVVTDSENPVWNAELLVIGWRPGDDLVFSVYDHDLVGNDDLLATLVLPGGQFFPLGFDGTLHLDNRWQQQAKMEDELVEHNMAAQPTMQVSITVQEDTLDLPPANSRDRAEAVEMSMPNVEPSLSSVCAHLDDFERSVTAVTVSHLGNFYAANAPAVAPRTAAA